MDHRIFQPRPTGNDARRRTALGMALVVLAALALWFYSLRTPSASPPVPTPVSAGASAPSH